MGISMTGILATALAVLALLLAIRWVRGALDCVAAREPYIEKSRLDYLPVEIRPDAHVLRVLTPRSDRAAS
jgi:hypothetical protein